MIEIEREKKNSSIYIIAFFANYFQETWKESTDNFKSYSLVRPSQKEEKKNHEQKKKKIIYRYLQSAYRLNIMTEFAVVRIKRLAEWWTTRS